MLYHHDQIKYYFYVVKLMCISYTHQETKYHTKTISLPENGQVSHKGCVSSRKWMSFGGKYKQRVVFDLLLSLRVWGQPVLHMKLPSSQSYIVRLCLKNNNKHYMGKIVGVFWVWLPVPVEEKEELESVLSKFTQAPLLGMAAAMYS